MAYLSGEASDIYDLFDAICDALIKAGWELVLQESSAVLNNQTRRTLGLFKGIGDGTDNIYIQFKLDTITSKFIFLDSCIGYDSALWYWEQAGSIQQWLKKSKSSDIVKQPAFTVPLSERFAYWIFVDNYRIIVVTRMSIIYESMYLGFINPITSERQYPYPMYVAGNTYASGSAWDRNTNNFIFGSSGSAYIRRADGVWRSCTFTQSFDYTGSTSIFPYNCKNNSLVPNYNNNNVMDYNFLLIPVILQANNPVDLVGILRDVYWVTGVRDIDAEKILVLNGEQYIVFDTKKIRGDNSYFCIKMGN